MCFSVYFGDCNIANEAMRHNWNALFKRAPSFYLPIGVGEPWRRWVYCTGSPSWVSAPPNAWFSQRYPLCVHCQPHHIWSNVKKISAKLSLQEILLPLRSHVDRQEPQELCSGHHQIHWAAVIHCRWYWFQCGPIAILTTSEMKKSTRLLTLRLIPSTHGTPAYAAMLL